MSRPREVIVLLQGFVEPPVNGRCRAGGTVVLITGDPAIIVDTGAPEQRQDLVDALRSHGVDAESIGFVVNTHGHLDHIGNSNLFPRAIFILDTDLAQAGEYWQHDFAAGPLELASADGGEPVVVMQTPGHTEHDLSVVVTTAAGVVAVVGDLFEYETDDQDGAWRAWSRNPGIQQASRDRILALADYVVPGHGGIFTTSRRPGAAGSR